MTHLYPSETIKLDYPGNQLFYTINRIPKTEENFNPIRSSRSSSDDDQIQILVVDSDGTGTNAKTEVNKMKKGISKISGVSNVQVTTSGRPNVGSGAFSGSEIFGIIVGIVVACCCFGFIYKRYDLEYYVINAKQTITPSTMNPVYNSNDEEVGIPTIQDGTELGATADQDQAASYHSSEVVDTEAGVNNMAFTGEAVTDASENDPITVSGFENQSYQPAQQESDNIVTSTVTDTAATVMNDSAEDVVDNLLD